MKYLTPILICLLATAANAQWYIYSPAGSVDDRGILADVLSRCDEQGRRTAYEADKVTYAHEATHMLNSRIRNSMGGTGKVNAIYVGAGHCFVLPEPHVTLATVSQYVSQYRNSTFQLYFVQQRQYWNDDPLYILDEWSAYTNGLQASQELRVDEHGELERAQWFCHYAAALLVAVQQNDPQYPKLAELAKFIEWQKARVTRMAGGPIKITTKPVQDCHGGACYSNGCCQQGYGQCYGGSCSSGQCSSGSCPSGNCGQSIYTGPIYQPAPRPQPVVVNPPLPSPPPVQTPGIPGKQGPAGTDGKQGPKGDTGPAGPAGTVDDEKLKSVVNVAVTAAINEYNTQHKSPTTDEVATAVLDKLKTRTTPIRVYSTDGKLLGESQTNIFKEDGSIDFTFNPRTPLDQTTPQAAH